MESPGIGKEESLNLERKEGWKNLGIGMKGWKSPGILFDGRV